MSTPPTTLDAARPTFSMYAYSVSLTELSSAGSDCCRLMGPVMASMSAAVTAEMW
jgi:hypothetical protein